jgi:hypothetical protein
MDTGLAKCGSVLNRGSRGRYWGSRSLQSRALARMPAKVTQTTRLSWVPAFEAVTIGP